MSLARSCGEAERDLVELVLAIDRQVRALGQVLAQEPVGPKKGMVMFSLLPRCQGLCGSAKYTATPVRNVNAA